jgi:hypothetical protein
MDGRSICSMSLRKQAVYSETYRLYDYFKKIPSVLIAPVIVITPMSNALKDAVTSDIDAVLKFFIVKVNDLVIDLQYMILICNFPLINILINISIK